MFQVHPTVFPQENIVPTRVASIVIYTTKNRAELEQQTGNTKPPRFASFQTMHSPYRMKPRDFAVAELEVDFDDREWTSPGIGLRAQTLLLE